MVSFNVWLIQEVVIIVSNTEVYLGAFHNHSYFSVVSYLVVYRSYSDIKE